MADGVSELTANPLTDASWVRSSLRCPMAEARDGGDAFVISRPPQGARSNALADRGAYAGRQGRGAWSGLNPGTCMELGRRRWTVKRCRTGDPSQQRASTWVRIKAGPRGPADSDVTGLTDEVAAGSAVFASPGGRFYITVFFFVQMLVGTAEKQAVGRAQLTLTGSIDPRNPVTPGPG